MIAMECREYSQLFESFLENVENGAVNYVGLQITGKLTEVV